MTGPKYDDDPFGTAKAAPAQEPQYADDPFGAASQPLGGGYLEDPYQVTDTADPEQMSDLERTVLGLPPKQAPTARGIAEATASNKAQNLAVLKALHDSPATSAAQKERLQRLMSQMEDPRFYNKVTEDRFFGSNFLRGTASGIVGDALLGTVDFASAIAELGAKGADALFDTQAEAAIEAWRAQIAEAQQITRDTFDAQGVSGAAGRVAGALAGQLVGGAERTAVTGARTAFRGGLYGAVAERSAELLSKLPGSIGRAAKLGQNGNWIQRAAINILSGLPIDAVQTLTIPESDLVKAAHAKQEQGIQLTPEEESALDEHWDEQLKTLGLGVAASGFGGALIEGGAKLLAVAGSPAAKVATGSSASEQELASTADALLALGEIAKKRNEARKAGAGAWNKGTIDIRKKLLDGLTDDQYAMDFSKLPADIKQALLEAFGGPKIGPIPPELGTPKAATAPVPATTAETPSPAPVAPAPAVPEAAAPSATALATAEVTPPGPVVQPIGPLPSESAGTVDMVRQAQDLVGRQGLTKEVAKVLKKRTNPPSNPQAMAAIVEAVARKIVDRHAAGGVTARVEAAAAEGKAAVAGAEAPSVVAPVDPAKQVSVIDEALTDVESKLATPRERELERRLADAERRATTDSKTGFQNADAWERAKSRIDADPSVEIVSLDIGHLKATNDHVSYDAGDELIRRAAMSIRGAVSDADKAQFFRVGGDELLAVVPKGRGTEVGDAAVKAFGVSPVGDIGVNSFLRYGVGATTREADAAVRLAKKESTEVRYDRKTKSAVKTVEAPVKPADPSDPAAEIERLKAQQITASPAENLRLQKRIKELRQQTKAAPSNEPEHGPSTKIEDGPPQPVVPEAPPPKTAEELEAEKLKPMHRLAGVRTDTEGKDLSKFSANELLNTKRSLRSMLNNVEKGSPDEAALQAEFKRIMDYEAQRDGGAGVTLRMHPSITGGVGGFMAGFLYPEDDPEDRLRNAVYFGAVGLAGGVYASRRWGPGVPRARPKLAPWEAEVAKKVLSYDDIKKPPIPFMMRLRQLYRGMVSRSAPVRAATKALGGENLPAQRNPGKLMQMFGRWQAQTESFLIDGPSLVDRDGNIQWLNSLPAQKIVEMVKGDTDRLGLLMASARALELGAKGVRTGIDALAARMTFIKSTPEYHQAMTEMRKFNGALVDTADDAGLVADRDKMSDVFYAPLSRIFGGQVGGAAAQQTITSKIKTALGVANPIKGLKGSEQALLNPAEATIDNVARVLRASELNKIATTFADLLDAAPDRELAGRLGKFLHGNERKQVQGYAVKVAQLQQELAAVGTTLSAEEADKLVHTFSNEALNLQDDVLRFWRKGKVEQLRLNPEIAKAFRSLNPEELSHLWKWLGIPTQTARLGIVNNPLFVARQAWRDNWQAWLNSEYGFIPFVTQAQGWFHAVSRSKEYKEYLAAGGGYGSFAEQRFARGQTALPDVQRAPVKNSLDQAAKEVSELRLLSAYQTLITPVVEAARVGEYLRARGRGKSAIEAVYAAKQVTANYQDIGTSMRAMGHLTLFLNPAIKSLEQSAHSFRRDPVAYLTKAFIGIALPSYYFWHTYQNDDELNQLRTTETGRRYWWARTPGGSIIKIPKPIFDGQLFGSTVETVLDREKLKDPESAKLTATAVSNDVKVNLLPQLGVVPYSLFVNKDLSTGQAIIPERVEGLDPQYQSGPTTTNVARIVGKETGVAPAQIDYVVRNVFGQLGINAVRMISSAIQYQETGYVSPKEEQPFIEEVFGRYPSQNVGAIREFYRGAETADRVGKTLGHAAKYDAENVGTYLVANQADASLVDLYKEARADLAELRASIEDIRLAPQGTIDPATRKQVIDALLVAMIAKAKSANLAARAVRESFQQTDIRK